MDDLLQEFIAETRETLAALAGEIVAWEADPADRERLDAIFRFVHTVKGSCGFLDLPRLARLSHAAEDVLAAVRSGDRVPDRLLVDAVLGVVDRIGLLVDAIDAGTAIDDSGEDALIASLAEGGAVAAVAATPTLPAGASIAKAQSRSVRLSVDLLDRMMSGMSEMVLARNDVARRMRTEDADPALEAAVERLSATVADMRETVTRMRMQRLDTLFGALPRIVRDTAAVLGKSVTLTIDGGDVELDREMIEVLRDPLVQIIRNAIDHGIEHPALRRAAGKSENGRLCVAARQSGNQIVIEVADDGAGIAVDRLIAKLVETGRDRAQLLALNDRQQLELIFQPGLSTKDEATEISGRGVGMDVVRAAIEQVGGRIALSNAVGRGLKLTVQLPLTLSIIPAIVVCAGGERFAVPRQTIDEILNEGNVALRVDELANIGVATLRGKRLPLIDLAAQLGLTSETAGGAGKVAVIGHGHRAYALRVDDVIHDEELVIKPAAPAVMASGVFAGQTLPDNGAPMLLLDCAGLASDAAIDFADEAQDGSEAHVGDASAVPEHEILLARDLDGAIRAFALAAVERIETVPTASVRNAGGGMHAIVGGRCVPLFATASLEGRHEVTALRLSDGGEDLFYAVGEPLEVVPMPADARAVADPGLVAGIVVIEGQAIECVDLHWLFAGRGRVAPQARFTCVLDDDPWLNSFVRPLLAQAGYRVASVGDGVAGHHVRLTIADQETGAQALCVSADPARGGDAEEIDRYDRGAIIAAVARRMREAG